MNIDVFIFIGAILGLSVLFFAASACLLRLRRKHGLRIHPLAYTILLLAALLPVASEVPFFTLRMYQNAPGDVRAEIYRGERLTVEESPMVGEVRVSASVWRAAQRSALFLTGLWLAISAAKLSFSVADYFDSVRVLVKNSKVCHGGELDEIFREAKGKVGLRRNAVLRVTELSISPCTTGFTSPVVFIPRTVAEEYSKEQLELIFLHELVHIRRCDIAVKFFTMIVCSLHWMMPLSRQIGQSVAEDCEYRCDGEVLSIVGDGARFAYISTILDLAERGLETGVEPMNGTDRSFTTERFSLTRNNLLNRATEDGGGTSGSGRFLLKRYEHMRKRMAVYRHTLYVFPLLVVTTAANMLLSSTVTVMNREDPGVDFLNPWLETAMCEYYGLADPADLAFSHVEAVSSLEFGLSEKYRAYQSRRTGISLEDLDPFLTGTEALTCVVNNGLLPLPEGTLAVDVGGMVDGISVQTAERRGLRYASDLLPDVIRADGIGWYLPSGYGDVIPTPGDDAVLSLYDTLYAGEGAVDAFTEAHYGAFLGDYGITDASSEGEVMAAIGAFCASYGVCYTGIGTVKDAISFVGQALLSADSPAAVYYPMLILREDVTEAELAQALDVVLETETGAQRIIDSPCLDLRDLPLFDHLRTLVFRDGLYTEQRGVYSSKSYAVIGEQP